MEIKLSKDLCLAIGVNNMKKFDRDITKEKLDYAKSIDLNLLSFDEKRLDILSKTLQPFAKDKSMKIKSALTAFDDVNSWIKAISAKDVKDVKARKVDQFASILRLYLQKVPGHRIYMKDIDRDAWYCYYVGKIAFIEKVRHRDSTTNEHVNMHLFWIEFGHRKGECVTFWPDDCRGLTCLEALTAKSYIIETKDLREKYLADKERFQKHAFKVGRQFLAKGIATDDLDGNHDDDDDRWRRNKTLFLDKEGEAARIVIDVVQENDEKKDKGDVSVDWDYWKRNKLAVFSDDEDDTSDDAGTDSELKEDEEEVEIPIHPITTCFDLRRHLRIKVHIDQMERYKYNPDLGESLVLPKENRALIEMLLNHRGGFKDIIQGKGQGAIIICAGSPGTGKTLTSEIYSEVSKRPLYTVHCSQLGTDPDNLEKELLKIFERAQRWNAILLLDESDVYVHSRGRDLMQNAIVGVFLRTLEYYKGVLFMTTNRADIIDDAILSRCIAKIDYHLPSIEDQRKIWKILAKSSGAKLSDESLDKIMKKYNNMSGRDIKNLLKLGLMMNDTEKKGITIDVIDIVKRFKPTQDLIPLKEEK